MGQALLSSGHATGAGAVGGDEGGHGLKPCDALSMPLASGVGDDRATDLQNLEGIGGVGPMPVFGDRTLATPPYGCASLVG